MLCYTCTYWTGVLYTLDWYWTDMLNVHTGLLFGSGAAQAHGRIWGRGGGGGGGLRVPTPTFRIVPEQSDLNPPFRKSCICP